MQVHAMTPTVPATPNRAKGSLQTNARNRGLDVLRGTAILLVFFNHVDSRTIPGFSIPEGFAKFVYWRIKNLGCSGVDLFFVLSGFLISGLLFKEIDETGGLRLARFWGRRAFKIIPSYYFLLLVLAVSGATGWLDSSSLAATGNSLFVHGLFFQNYLANTMNGPTWSLAAEEHFYLLLPLFLLFVRSRGAAKSDSRKFLFMIVLMLLLPLAFRVQRAFSGIQLNDFMLTHFRFDGLLFGVLCQWLIRTKSPLVAIIARHKSISILASGLLLLPVPFYARSHPFMFTVGFSMAAMGYAILLLLTVSSEPGHWRKSWPAGAVAAVGIWSYNIYLWHYFLGEVRLPFYREAQRWITAQVPGAGLTASAQFVFFASVAIGIGALVTQIIEKPFLLLRDRIPALATKRRSPRERQEGPGLAAPSSAPPTA